MLISSSNEWDTLKSIIVGSATNARLPSKCPKFRELESTTAWQETPVPKGKFPQSIIDEANEDLELFSDTLKSLGVKVVRPKDMNFESFDGMYNYCPRDRVLIIDDVVVDAPMVYPTRIPEIEAIRENFTTLHHNEDEEVFFDAANVCRLGKDLLYLVSSSGNVEGGLWLALTFPHKKVHILENIYSGVHIDSTIVPVREGLVVINADRITKENMPSIFEDWEIIPITKKEMAEQSFYKYPYASNYIGLNFLSVNPQLVICDPKQEYLRSELQKRGVESIGVDLRHSRTLGGGHHCVTLDMERVL